MFFGTRLRGVVFVSFLSMPGLGWHLRECGLHSEEAHAHFIPVQRNPGVEWIVCIFMYIHHVSPHVNQGKSMEIIHDESLGTAPG